MKTLPVNKTSPSTPREALGESEAFLAFNDQLSRVAKVDRPVLIIGERGTGKELAAARLHFLSPRWQEPLVALNCAALPSGLIESELFGYESGAFTGAQKRRQGRFEAADRGTLFLDEIGNIPLEVQAKILRAVEYQTFERVGSSAPIQVDVRIVGATNADLPAQARAGRFKQDLLDRLSFEVLWLPPLRERIGDVLLLANKFAARMAFELGREGVPILSEAAAARLEAYQWPGNVRELKNVVERAVYRTDSDTIEAEDIVLDPFTEFQPVSPVSDHREIPETIETRPEEIEDAPLPESGSFNDRISAYEIRILVDTLRKAQYNQKKAAETLGLTYHQFRGLYRKHGLKDVMN